MPEPVDPAETPDGPPGLLEMPELPETPDGPPEVPEVPELPETPDGPPEVPELPETPDGPPEVPEVPELPETPDGPPEVPEVPETPGAPEVYEALPAESQGLVELVVAEVRAAVPLRPGQEAGLAVLAEADEPFRSLHIYIGQSEARAIQAGRRGDRPERPGTWDLLLAAVEMLGGSLVGAVIDRAEEGRHFFAFLELLVGGEIRRLPCRPSDAIALVVRAPEATLYAQPAVMTSAGRYP